MCQEVETSFLSASFSPPLPLLMPPISPIPQLPAHIVCYTPSPCNDNSLSHVPAIIPYSRVRLASASLVVIISFSPAPLSSLSGSQILKIEIRGRVGVGGGAWGVKLLAALTRGCHSHSEQGGGKLCPLCNRADLQMAPLVAVCLTQAAEAQRRDTW